MIMRWAIIAALLGLGAGCAEEPPSDAPETARLFAKHCKRCHGAAGTGNFLKGVPPNRETALTRDEIVDLIRHGRPDFDKMPKFPRIRRREAEMLADRVLELKAQSHGEKMFWTVPPAANLNPRP